MGLVAEWSELAKAILFIGLLLVFTVIAYTNHRTKGTEGFQAAATPASQRTNLYPMPSESAEEAFRFDIYDSKFMPEPKEPFTTDMEKFNSAGALVEFDLGAEIPWDYDNKDFDPKEILWGTVVPYASQSIFNKAYNREMFQSGNNIEFSQQEQAFKYRSNLFEADITDPNVAIAVQYAEFAADFALEEVFEGGIDKAKDNFLKASMAKRARDQALKKLAGLAKDPMAYTRQAMFDKLPVNEQMELLKKDMPAAELEKFNKDIARDTSFMNRRPSLTPTQQKELLFQRRTADGFVDDTILKSKFDDAAVKGELRSKGLLNADGNVNSLKFQEKVTTEIPARGKAAKAASIADAKAIKLELKTRKIVQLNTPITGLWDGYTKLKGRAGLKVSKGMSAVGKGFKSAASKVYVFTAPLRRAAVAAARTVVRVVVGVLNSTIAKRIGVTAAAKLLKFLMVGVAKLLGGLVAKTMAVVAAVNIFLNVTYPGVGTAIGIFLTAFSLACIAVVPAILSTVVDPDPDSTKCPGPPDIDDREYYSIRDEMYKLDGGEAGFEILSAIPIVGDLISALGPYICTKKDGSKSVLRVPYASPPYYYDSALSIFYAMKTPMDGCYLEADSSPNYQCSTADKMFKDMREFSLFEPSVRDNPRRANSSMNNRIGAYQTFWVDYSNKKMLDKMAQYYHIMSRKHLKTEYDGRVSYEYISKFYGLIASSEFSCDVQCEITKVIFEPYTGNNYEKVIVEPPSLITGMKYHDRRFYFVVDHSRGKYASVDKAGTKTYIQGDKRPSRKVLYENGVPGFTNHDNALDELMRDNMDKFIITGCTHTYGTAYDVMETTEEGAGVGDSPIGLGTRGELYAPPVVVLGEDSKVPESEDDCKTYRTGSYMKFGSRYVPAAREKPGETGAGQVSGAVVKAATDMKWAWGKEDMDDGNLKPLMLGNDNTKEFSMKFSPPSLRQQIGQGVFTGVMGALPLGFGFEGGMIATTLQTSGAAGIMSCWWADIQSTPGTFILNGRVITNASEFVIDRGPTIEYAPGYKPEIRFCEPVVPKTEMSNDNGLRMRDQTGIELGLLDCASRTSLRRAIRYYEDTYMEAGKQFRVKRISSITPRRKSPNVQVPMCVYEVEEVQFNAATQQEVAGTETTSRIAVYHDLVEDPDNRGYNHPACVYAPKDIPRKQAITVNVNTYGQPNGSQIPPIEPLEMGFKDFDFSGCADPTARGSVCNNPMVKTPPPAPYKFLLPSAGSENITCADPDLMKVLQDLFNVEHAAEDVSIDLVGITDKTKFTYTPVQIGNNYRCVYHAPITKVKPFDPASDDMTNPITKTFSDTIQIYFKSLGSDLKPPAVPRCAVDYVGDTYEDGYVYMEIPEYGNFFEMPPRPAPPSDKFLRGGCFPGSEPQNVSQRAPYSDCSGAPIVTSLIAGFNQSREDRKILRVFRASTPLTNVVQQTNGTIAECDYEVDMLRTFVDDQGKLQKLMNRETVRIQAKPDPNDSCGYIYENDYSDTQNSGGSIQKDGIIDAGGNQSGALNTPILWAPSFLQRLQDRFNSLIRPITSINGKTAPEVMKQSSRPAYQTMVNLDALTIGSQTLENCNISCSDTGVMKRVINRYNFDASPPYPDGQFGVKRRTIERIRRAGRPEDPNACQFELIERVDTYVNSLRKPETVQRFLRKFQFRLENTQTSGTACTYRIAPLTQEDFENNTMDISGNPIGIRADQSLLKDEFVPGKTGIDPFDTNTLKLLKTLYETTDTRGMKAATGRLNQIKSVTAAFVARPNVIEYYAKVDHWSWDADYGTAYQTTDDDTFLVLTWEEGEGYNVDDAEIVSNDPKFVSVKEFFPPDVDLRSDGAYMQGKLVKTPYLFTDMGSVENSISARQLYPDVLYRSAAVPMTSL